MIGIRKAGGFGLGMAIVGSLMFSLHAADVTSYAIYKRQVYIQTNGAAPVLRCSPYVVDALVELTSSNSVSAAMVGVSNNPAMRLEDGYEAEFLPLRWVALGCSVYTDQQALDAIWPSGDYTFSIFGATDGAITAALNLSGDDYPKQPPHIQNFAEAQAVDASKDFTLRWDHFVGGTTNDFSFVLVRKVSDETPVTNTPFIGEANALDGTVTEIVIPAGTLAKDEIYDVYVRFDKVVGRNTTSYPGVTGQSSYASGTHFTLKTTSGATASR